MQEVTLELNHERQDPSLHVAKEKIPSEGTEVGVSMGCLSIRDEHCWGREELDGR